MSINLDDLRGFGGILSEEAANEIESLTQELADSNKAYELLFSSHSRLRSSHDDLVKALGDILEQPKETFSDGKALIAIVRIARDALGKVAQ